MGHNQQKKSLQTQFAFHHSHWKFRYNHGGTLRQKRRGRGARPLSTRAPIHLVFKANRSHLRRGYRSPLGFQICNNVIKRYSKKFFVKIEQQAICNDHIHLLVRFTRRSLGQHFLRVVAGQIAQQMQKNGFLVTDTPQKLGKKRKVWKFRPFSRVIIGWRPYLVVRDYVRLNEKEARGEIKYKAWRLKGLSPSEWDVLWS